MNPQDQEYMQAALKLAGRGIGSVEPNPVVGCIIAKGGQVVGKGWHRKFGGDHAELNALKDCKTLGVSPQGATMYVTLEPCCHYGKTPPCTDAIIAARLARVVVATVDPSEQVNGKSIEQLHRAGIDVATGVCEKDARLLNAPFIKFASTGKCWTVLKWAQTIDGKLAYADPAGDQRWISGELARKDMHKLRRRCQAILVGINTVIADDPLLTPRPARDSRPARVVLDSRLRIPLDCRLLATAAKTPVIIFTTESAIQANLGTADALRQKGAELLTFPDVPGRSNLHFLLEELGRRGVAQLLVEGGPTVIGSFLKERLVDEVCIYIAPRLLGCQGAADITGPLTELTEVLQLQQIDIRRFGDDVRLTGFAKKAVEEIFNF